MNTNERDALVALAEVLPPKPLPNMDYSYEVSPAHARELHSRFDRLVEALAAPAEGDGAVAVAQVRRGGRAGPHDALYAGLIPRGPATPEVKEGDLLYLRPAATAVVPDRIVLWSRNVAPHWYFIAAKSERPDIEGAPVYETLDPIVLKGSPEAAPAAPKGGVVDSEVAAGNYIDVSQGTFHRHPVMQSGCTDLAHGRYVRIAALATGEQS